MYIVHNAWVCLLASWFISCLLPRAHPLIGFLWWICIIAKLPCCHGCFFSMTWLFRFIWVTRSSVGSQTVKECEYMWIVEEKKWTHLLWHRLLVDRQVRRDVSQKDTTLALEKFQKLIQWEAIWMMFFPKRKVVFQPWIFMCELFVSGRVSKTQTKKRKYIPVLVTFLGWWVHVTLSKVNLWPPTFGDQKVTAWITWFFETWIYIPEN